MLERPDRNCVRVAWGVSGSILWRLLERWLIGNSDGHIRQRFTILSTIQCPKLKFCAMVTLPSIHEKTHCEFILYSNKKKQKIQKKYNKKKCFRRDENFLFYVFIVYHVYYYFILEKLQIEFHPPLTFTQTERWNKK